MHDAPARSQARRPFLTAAWHHLVMLSWPFAPDTLTQFLAHGTELDLWQGQALASIVAFDFRDTRVLGIPVPWHIRFPEVNLRFYVRRRAPDGFWRRGVIFIQEIVPRWAIATVARTLYGEPYIARPMRQQITEPAGSPGRRTLEYAWRRRGRWERVVATTTTDPQAMTAGSIEEFIAEHYWGYTRRPGRATLEYEVVHPRWRITPVTDYQLDADLETLYPEPFSHTLRAAPLSAFVAEGSAVAVHRGQPVPFPNDFV